MTDEIKLVGKWGEMMNKITKNWAYQLDLCVNSVKVEHHYHPCTPFNIPIRLLDL